VFSHLQRGPFGKARHPHTQRVCGFGGDSRQNRSPFPISVDPVSHQPRHSYLGKRETRPYPLTLDGSEEARITFILQFAFRYSPTHTLPLQNSA
jgi:hypothetical protein